MLPTYSPGLAYFCYQRIWQSLAVNSTQAVLETKTRAGEKTGKRIMGKNKKKHGSPNAGMVATTLSELPALLNKPITAVPKMQLDVGIPAPPAAPICAQITEKYTGYVLESKGYSETDVYWTKVLLKHENKWKTALIERPSVAISIGAVVEGDLEHGTRAGRPALLFKNPIVKTTESPVRSLMVLLLNDDTFSEPNTKLVYLSDLAEAVLDEPDKSIKQALKERLGIRFFIASVDINKFIVAK